MKCKDCSSELDVKQDYCASCVGKGFDLRPYEVKNVFSTKFVVYVDDKIVGVALLYTAAWSALGDIPKTHPNAKKVEIRAEEVVRDWTFEEIQVGWFFKSGRFVYIKTEDNYCCAIYFSEGCIAWHFDNMKYHTGMKIDKVYDCPELAKTLMIEEIIT